MFCHSFNIELAILGLLPLHINFIFFYFINLSIYLFIYLFLAALGLCCCARSFFSCVEQRLLFIEVCRLLVVAASLVAEHGLKECGLSSCGTSALERRFSSCGARA